MSVARLASSAARLFSPPPLLFLGLPLFLVFGGAERCVCSASSGHGPYTTNERAWCLCSAPFSKAAVASVTRSNRLVIVQAPCARPHYPPCLLFQEGGGGVGFRHTARGTRGQERRRFFWKVYHDSLSLTTPPASLLTGHPPHQQMDLRRSTQIDGGTQQPQQQH